MHHNSQVVTSLPLTEIWDDRGQLLASRLGDLNQEALRQLIRRGTVKFAIANVGHPLQWVPPEESHVFWKLEVRPHLVIDPERPFSVFIFPEGYCYVASQWEASHETQPIVLLERHH